MSEGGSKTEKATPRRREEARKEGQVARSEDLSHLILFGFFFSYLIIDGARLGAELTRLILLPYAYLGQPFPTAARTLTMLILTKALSLIFVILIASVAFSFVTQLIQIGPLFSSKSITPSLKKLNMVRNIKEMFSVNAAVDLIKMIFKTVLMVGIIYTLLVGNLRLLLNMPPYGVAGILYTQGQLMRQLTITIFFVFSVIAFFDFFWQRHRHDKQLMMQKHEVQRERKDNEGDPHTKEFRRNLFREIVSGDVERIPFASAVVANPTHLAVALFYKPPLTGLPIILAKGRGAGAEAIFKAARDAGVPIIQNVAVARRLYPLKVFSAIPGELIDAVAEIIVTARQIRRAAGHDIEHPVDEEAVPPPEGIDYGPNAESGQARDSAAHQTAAPAPSTPRPPS